MKALADAADLPVGDLRRDADIGELGLDSLDFWTILMDVEDRAGVSVPAEVFERLAQLDARPTVGDLIDAMSDWETAAG